MKLIAITSYTQFVLIALLSLSVINTVHAGKLYKWVDATGRVSYQDRPPPKNAKILSEKSVNKKPVKTTISTPVLKTEPVDVYVAKSCVSCDEMIEALTEFNVAFNERNIEEFRDIQNVLIQQTSSIRVPALFIDGKFINNTNNEPFKLKLILQQHGYLAKETQALENGTGSDQLEDSSAQ